MKPIIITILLALSFSAASNAFATGSTRTKGYVTKQGTYVAPHYKTRPNNTKMDNYSTKGNYNPYTGKTGTKSPYSSSRRC